MTFYSEELMRQQAHFKRFSSAPKQDWAVGNIVKVGFVKDLEILQKVPTPGDYRPDIYVLQQQNTKRVYRFTPRLGLERCESIEEAAQW